MKCSKASAATIKKWCSKIHRSDIAVVYYSGANPQSVLYKGTWPLTAIGTNSVPLSWKAKRVHSRNARLSLVFADCYNQYIKLTNFSRRFYGRALEQVKKKKIQQKIRNVWSSEKGSLTICSNKQDQKSYGVVFGKRKVGAFTEALLMAFVGGAYRYTESGSF